MNVHNKIRAIRESKKIPQKKMAEELNVSRQTMTAIETQFGINTKDCSVF